MNVTVRTVLLLSERLESQKRQEPVITQPVRRLALVPPCGGPLVCSLCAHKRSYGDNSA